MHSTHLPIPKNQVALDQTQLFIAHLQWLDKNYVAIIRDLTLENMVKQKLKTYQRII